MNPFTQSVIDKIEKRTGAKVTLYTSSSGTVAVFINDYHVGIFPNAKLTRQVLLALHLVAKFAVHHNASSDI